MDKEIVIGHSRIQHGKWSDRIYVMDFKHDEDSFVLNRLHLLAKDYSYGKIIAKIPLEAKEIFTKYEFDEEAYIPAYYNGEKDCCFMSKYFFKDRKLVVDKNLIVTNLKKLKLLESSLIGELKKGYYIRQLNKKDIDRMVMIFKEVFKTYPFPIHDPRFVEKTMDEETVYFGVFYNDQLIGVSSCEMNKEYQNVEMTDFAIVPMFRGKRLAKYLLVYMEKAMKEIGMKTAYTIARSLSYPMNATFSGCGYYYGGTLWNNTQIAGKIESMNVWHKPLHN